MIEPAPNPMKSAVAVNIEVLAEILSQAAARAKLAVQAIEDDKQNLAMGTILDFDQTLPAALSLYNAALLLHRAGL